MIVVALACLLESGSSFLITSGHVTTMFQHRRQQRAALGSTTTTTASTTALAAVAEMAEMAEVAAPSTQTLLQSPSPTAEAVHSVFVESLVAEADIRKQVTSLAEAKRELLERVGYGTQAPGADRPKSEEDRVGYLLEVLEQNNTPIQTVGFYNFAAQVRFFARQLR